MPLIDLPVPGRRLGSYRLSEPRSFPRTMPFNRVAFSAAHVVADPWAEADPWLQNPIDWDATLAFRRHLWSLGLGVAEAMDTAQRGMGLGWTQSLELIQRSVREAASTPGALTSLRRRREDVASRIEALEGEIDRRHVALHAPEERTGLSYRALLGELIGVEAEGLTISVPRLRYSLGSLSASAVAELEETCGPLASTWLKAAFEGSPLDAFRPFSVDEGIASRRSPRTSPPSPKPTLSGSLRSNRATRLRRTILAHGSPG